jgi:hypothetical protein
MIGRESRRGGGAMLGPLRSSAVLAATALTLGLVASPAAAGDPPKLKVRLIEFEVQPAREFVAKGKTEIVAKNGGTEKHEIVVVRGDDPEALPTDTDGAVDESQIPKKDQLGEIEEFKPKKTKTKVFKLKPGSYILFCNIVEEEEDGTIVSHFAEGMHATIEAS